MDVVDDIEFYGRAVDAGEMTREAAIAALVAARNGGLTEVSAAHQIDRWETARSRYERILFDTYDTLRALRNGQPWPEHTDPFNKRVDG